MMYTNQLITCMSAKGKNCYKINCSVINYDKYNNNGSQYKHRDKTQYNVAIKQN